MEIIDVDKLEKDNKKDNFIESLKEKMEKRKAMQGDKKAPRPKRIMIKGMSRQRNAPQERRVTKKEETEVFDSVKSFIFKGLSMPMKNEKKREVLNNRLQSSKYMNSYLQDNLYADYIDGLNPHYKAGFIYTYHYLNVLTEDVEKTNNPQIKNKE